LYIVEADCDRPSEGKFLASLLKPEVTVLLAATRSHSGNFPIPVDETIAFEFGYFLEFTQKMVIVNGDSLLIKKQLPRTKAIIESISIKDLQNYLVDKDHTEFRIKGNIYSLNFLLPRETYYQIAALLKILDYLNIQMDPLFKNFNLPPGRSSLFKGIKNTTILDSSYNADLGSAKVMLNLFNQITVYKKWLVLGDMIEQGEQEQQEHEELAEVLNSTKLDKIIFVGPRLLKYTYPKLNSKVGVEKFIMPTDALKYIKANLKGRPFLLFKGARFLEGIIEHLLKDKSDVSKLCRRELAWQERRKQWGL